MSGLFLRGSTPQHNGRLQFQQATRPFEASETQRTVTALGVRVGTLGLGTWSCEKRFWGPTIGLEASGIPFKSGETQIKLKAFCRQSHHIDLYHI